MTKAVSRTFIWVASLLTVSLACAGSLGFAAAGLAAPAVTMKVRPVPISGFPGTGNILGAGAAVEARYTITGTEYGGYPSPLTRLVFDAPAGVKVTPQGFPTCAAAQLEDNGAEGCPTKSRAGPLGEGLGAVSFGGTRVDEPVTLQSFFSPSGGLSFYVVGSSPVSLQIVESAHWFNAPAPFGPGLLVEVPLVSTVPGAPYASVLSFKVQVGAAYRKGKRTVSYFTLPKRCPKGGFPLKSELKFLSGETTIVAYREPCPRD
jgi:hypothetical protein